MTSSSRRPASDRGVRGGELGRSLDRAHVVQGHPAQRLVGLLVERSCDVEVPVVAHRAPGGARCSRWIRSVSSSEISVRAAGRFSRTSSKRSNSTARLLGRVLIRLAQRPMAVTLRACQARAHGMGVAQHDGLADVCGAVISRAARLLRTARRRREAAGVDDAEDGARGATEGLDPDRGGRAGDVGGGRADDRVGRPRDRSHRGVAAKGARVQHRIGEDERDVGGARRALRRPDGTSRAGRSGTARGDRSASWSRPTRWWTRGPSVPSRPCLGSAAPSIVRSPGGSTRRPQAIVASHDVGLQTPGRSCGRARARTAPGASVTRAVRGARGGDGFPIGAFARVT